MHKETGWYSKNGKGMKLLYLTGEKFRRSCEAMHYANEDPTPRGEVPKWSINMLVSF